MGSLSAAHKVVFGRDIKLTSRLQTAQFVPIIRSLMIISTLRASPVGPLFLFWAIGWHLETASCCNIAGTWR